MKATSLALLAALLIPAATGCFRAHGSRCHSGHCGAPGGASGGAYGASNYPPGLSPEPTGPPSATVTYPYYTTRGPRDFLVGDPPSIGP